MQKQIMNCINLGMSRDIGISLLSEKLANYTFENHNIRISATNDNTLYTVTNEKGTQFKIDLNGTFLGSCVINNYLIIFTKLITLDSVEGTSIITDYIYRLEYNSVNDTFVSNILYNGDLGFSLEHPIDAIGYYESEEVLKVYWVDGINPNRFINIANDKNGTCPDYSSGNIYLFDFLGHINSVPDISITKNYNKAGTFQAGTIQYFATYYNKYGTETCIVWQSDLLYISMSDRGAKPDEIVSCAFDFTLSNLDTTYDYIRIYAAYRAGLNGTAEGRIVTELEIKDGDLSFSDYGTNYQNYNAEDIHYLGGLNIIASTLDYKLDTLFLGDIKLDNTLIPKDHLLYTSLKNCTDEYIEDLFYINSCNDITFQYKELPSPDIKGVYSYLNLLSNSQKDIAGFKHREVYRFAILFMTVTGEWTTPIYIGDKYCNLPPTLQENTQTYKIAQAVYTMNTAAINNLNQWNIDNPGREFIQIRLLVAEMDNESRRILAQGVVNPTMFNYYDRQLNRPYSINSWLFRPRKSNIVNKHYDCMYTQDSNYAEIQGITERKSPSFDPNNQSEEKNSYALAIALHGDWITGHELTYELFKYTNDGGLNTITYDGVEYLCNYEIGQSSHNSNIEIKTNSTLILSDEKRKELNNKDKVRQWLINELVENGIDISDEMIPTGQLFKDMRRANSLTQKPGMVWGIIGAALVTVAGVVASIFSFGAATAPASMGITLLWSSLLAGIGTTAAVAGSAGVAAIAEQFKDALDIDYQFAKKGFYCLLPNLVHTNSNEELYKEQYDNWRSNLFGRIEPSNGINSMDANRAVVVTRIGRTTFLSPKELNAKNKRDLYYIDESIITLNSPDIENVQYAVDNSKALKLDLVGTIPITSSHSESLMYAQQGVGNNSLTIPTVLSNAYPSSNIEGLLNGGLYLDIVLESFFYNDDLEKGEIGWPNIEPTDLMSLYKIFMWNRETSWSCYIPGINIIDPVQLNDETTSYLQYIPAIPIKKIFSNLKYSHNTTYRPFYTLDIELPKVYTDGEFKLLQFNSNNLLRNYYGAVELFMINEEGYVLLQSNNSPLWEQPDDLASQLKVYDPVGIKYKSTSHAIIPLKWEKELNLLPYLRDESNIDLLEFYSDITETSIVEGLEIKLEIYGIGASQLPAWIPTDEYPNDPLETLEEGAVVNESIINIYKKLIVDSKLEGGLDSIDSNLNATISAQYICQEHTHSGANTECPSEVIMWYSGTLDDSDKVEIKLNIISSLDIEKLDTWCNATRTKYIKGSYENKNWVWRCKTVDDELLLEDYTVTENTTQYGGSKIQEEILNSLGTELENAVEEVIYNLFLEAKGTTTLTMDEWQLDNHPYESQIKERFRELKFKEWNNYWQDRVRTLSKAEYSKTNYFILGIDSGLGWDYRLKTNYSNQILLLWEESNPYLFVGEFVKKDFDYDNWLGGNSDFALQLLNWNICSNSYSIDQSIDLTWGDTYYLRWDCLKTYPTTELDKNSIVEVLSFMVESHTNLDGRSDVNRGIHNLLNLRPSNTNLFNPVYNQQDNFFSYKVLDEKFDKNVFGNQIVWSLSKTNLDNIDKWTDIHAINSLQLDGRLGSINKIINMNDTLLAFLDTGISTIDYNLKSALTTYEGVPLQMGNTGKVTGYTKVTSDIGCHNKWAMCLTEAGLFFIDSYKKTLYKISSNSAPINISKTGYFDVWFKDNIDNNIWNPSNSLNAYRLNYDSLTLDLYIMNDTNCLVYNTGLNVFTSFMDYVNTPILLNLQGKSIAFNQTENTVNIYTMFEGQYNDIYGINREYSMEYRLSPSSYTDNLFTNYLYIADWTNPSTKSNDKNQFERDTRFNHFDIVEAWNEYLHGILTATTGTGIKPVKTKFRIWRGDIPKDGDTTTGRILKGDRMRNPWIHLKFIKDTTNDNTKMTFHNLNVIYYN